MCGLKRPALRNNKSFGKDFEGVDHFDDDLEENRRCQKREGNFPEAVPAISPVDLARFTADRPREGGQPVVIGTVAALRPELALDFPGSGVRLQCFAEQIPRILSFAGVYAGNPS